MPVCLSYEQIRQFSKEGLINLIEIFEKNLLDSKLLEFQNIVASNLSTNTSKLRPEHYVYAGRDIWQKSDHLKVLITKGIVSQIASCLWWSEKNIRVLYDQLILLDKKSTDPYLRSFFNGSFCPIDYSCFDNVLGSVIVCMNGVVTDWYQNKDTCPGMSGDVVCISKDKNILVSTEFSGSVLYMVTFGGFQSTYVENMKDPCVYALKSEGYVFGQKLLLSRHPFIKKLNMF